MKVFHQFCLKRILRVKFFNHLRNSEKLQRTNQYQIRLLVAIRHLKWFGHPSRIGDVVFLNACWDDMQGMEKEDEGRKGQPGSTTLKKIWK